MTAETIPGAVLYDGKNGSIDLTLKLLKHRWLLSTWYNVHTR